MGVAESDGVQTFSYVSRDYQDERTRGPQNVNLTRMNNIFTDKSY